MRRLTRFGMGALLLGGIAACGKPGPTNVEVVVPAEAAGAVEAAPAKLDREAPPAKASEPKEPVSLSASAGTFEFPADEGGKALAKLLLPGEAKPLARPRPTRPVERPIPAAIERPSADSSPGAVAMPRLPAAKPAPIRPAPAPERVPFHFARVEPELPARPNLPVAGLFRLPAPDVKKPVPVPTLAQAVTDRASLEDPTADFSARSVIGAPLPIRSTIAPFVKVNLPDPFEHSDTARLRLDLPETLPQGLGSLPTPRR